MITPELDGLTAVAPKIVHQQGPTQRDPGFAPGGARFYLRAVRTSDSGLRDGLRTGPDLAERRHGTECGSAFRLLLPDRVQLPAARLH